MKALCGECPMFKSVSTSEEHRPAISHKNIFWILEYVQTPVIKSNNSKDLL